MLNWQKNTYHIKLPKVLGWVYRSMSPFGTLPHLSSVSLTIFWCCINFKLKSSFLIARSTFLVSKSTFSMSISMLPFSLCISRNFCIDSDSFSLCAWRDNVGLIGSLFSFLFFFPAFDKFWVRDARSRVTSFTEGASSPWSGVVSTLWRFLTSLAINASASGNYNCKK